MKKLSFFEKNMGLSLVLLLITVALGFVASNIEGGLLNEALIYDLMGGMERTPILLNFSKLLAFIGSAKIIIPLVVVLLVFAYMEKGKAFIAGLISSSLGVFLLNSILKTLFQRQRPIDYMLAEELSSSYPSGHTMTNTCLYLFLAYYLSRFISPKHKKLFYLLAILLSLLMGFSRVHLGVHYISDVIGGILGGYGFFIISVNLVEALSRYKV